MARSDPVKTIRVNMEIAARAEVYANRLNWSFNRFGEHAIEAICRMIEQDPDARFIPEMVRQLDAIKHETKVLKYDPAIETFEPPRLAVEKPHRKKDAG